MYTANADDSESPGAIDEELFVFSVMLNKAMLDAELPQDLCKKLMEISDGSPDFYKELHNCLDLDYRLRELVDKQNSLPPDYAPADLVALDSSVYFVSREGLMLRKEAAAALKEMAVAARADGVTLVAASAYRSYDYQVEVYNRNVRELGQEAADRESARPGFSQHQTGLVLDFSPIDDSFAKTAASGWLTENAFRFGWSLSFPDGYEAVTGYRWESWHYRYVGTDLAAFINKYFGGIQQYALRFLHEWEKETI